MRNIWLPRRRDPDRGQEENRNENDDRRRRRGRGLSERIRRAGGH
jgi:hypothetical protein